MTSGGLLSGEQHTRLLAVVLGTDRQGRTFGDAAGALTAAFPDGERFPALCAALLLLETACDDARCVPAERALCWQLLIRHDGSKLASSAPWDYAMVGWLSAPLPPRPGGADAGGEPEVMRQLRQLYVCLRPDASSAGGAAAARPPLPGAAGGAPSLPVLLGPAAAWRRPELPALPPTSEELHWLYPSLHTGLLWDSSVGEDTSVAREACELASRALRGPLLPAQESRLLSALSSDPRLAHRLGVEPQHLPSLVEHSPAVASALLLTLLRPRPSGRVEELMDVLARSEMSLHGMEVVNRLAASVELPPEFVHLYISNCIGSCEGTQDKFVQSRLVRLVCVFLQSLIRNRVLAAADLLHELQAFCINFSRIKEAAKLFRLLKQMEGGALPMGGAGSSSGLGLGAAGVVGGDGLELTLTSHAISSGGDETGGGGSGEDGGG